MMKENTYRIDVVDALRGFAILGILLMHSYEQYNLFIHATMENKLMLFTDKVFSNAVPFLFAGKSYEILHCFSGLPFLFRTIINNKKEPISGGVFCGGWCYCFSGGA